MEIIHLILGIIVAIACSLIIKHMIFKKTSKLLMTLLLMLILFLIFSYAFKNTGSFQDNKFVKTGAVIAEEVVKIFQERIDSEQIINSTVKSNKLFKS
ncbi:MAG: hypothetical protein Q8O03_06520 [Nanoarchaeota archaeon]|nr:hypothetical protein [Nanoarchaeota archaeon]